MGLKRFVVVVLVVYVNIIEFIRQKQTYFQAKIVSAKIRSDKFIKGKMLFSKMQHF